jgi:hypothetical protein
LLGIVVGRTLPGRFSHPVLQPTPFFTHCRLGSQHQARNQENHNHSWATWGCPLAGGCPACALLCRLSIRCAPACLSVSLHKRLCRALRGPLAQGIFE